MVQKNALTEKHSIVNDAKFRLKSFLLIIKRKVQNLGNQHRKFTVNSQLKNEPVISFSESDLWNPDDNDQNWILTAGKIENLRLAIKNIDGIEVPAHKTFSFWKHMGNPNFGKGYVVGREIREGCIVPTKGGGLCQLSNALYDAAIKAEFQIIERHKHTKVIKGSLAEQNRDATVKWNYVDLRFKAPYPFRIETEMGSEKLIIQFRSSGKKEMGNDEVPSNLSSSKLNDCYSCGNLQCFKHPTGLSKKQKRSITTFILDEKWNEYDTFIQSITEEKDLFILPLSKKSLFKTQRYAWSIPAGYSVKTLPLAAVRRAFSTRFASKANKNIFATQLRLDKKVAQAASKYIPVECNHLVVSQNLLPFLWAEGVLAGRTFDVLMTRLPFEKLHERLNLAYERNSESKTLNDFRASQSLLDLENMALTKSRKIITPHAEIAHIFNNKSIKLDWNSPSNISPTKGKRILFPSSTIGRKGAYEVRQLAKELDLTIVITRNIKESDQFWQGIKTEPASENIFDDIGLVLYPTYIENQPRLVLKAMALGIPVITTTAAGLNESANLTIVPVGDYEAFKRACMLQIEKNIFRQPV